MVIFFIVILIALVFGFIFAKLDSLTKTIRIIRDDVARLQTQVDKANKDK